MLRRNLLVLPLFTLACGKAGKSPEDALPLEVGGWKRGDISSLSELPAGAVSGAQTLYLGEGRVNVRALDYGNETVAFEKMQQWRQADGFAASRGSWFFIAQPGPGATSETTMALLALLKNHGAGR